MAKKRRQIELFMTVRVGYQVGFGCGTALWSKGADVVCSRISFSLYRLLGK